MPLREKMFRREPSNRLMVGVDPKESRVLALAEHVHHRQSRPCEPTGQGVVGNTGDDAGTSVECSAYRLGIRAYPDKSPVVRFLRIRRHAVHKTTSIFA